MSDTAQTEKKRSPLMGLWLVIVKVGGKILPVLTKLLKVLKFGKVAMLGISFAAYAVLFSWKFAVVLLGSLFIHECGHIWAMKRHGLRTKGVYFIPLLGAAAVSEDAFPTRKAEVEIALMGPLWGFGLALATFGLYLATGSVLIASLAGWMAMLNLFNLLPINPLDGGRVMKSIAYSIHSKAGFWFLVAGFVGCYFLAHRFGLGLITFLMIIGSIELLSELKKMRQGRDREAIFTKLDCLAALAPEIADRKTAIIEGIRRACSEERDDIDVSLLSQELRAHYARYLPVAHDPLTRVIGLYIQEVPGTASMVLGGPSGDVPPSHAYAMTAAICQVAMDACTTRKRWFTRKLAKDTYFFSVETLTEVLQQRSMPTMTPRETGLSFLAYGALAVVLAALMFAVQHIPAAGAALQVFIG